MFPSPPPFPNHRPPCPIDQLPEPLRAAALHVIVDKKAPAAAALTDALAAAGAVVHCGFDCLAPDGERLPATLNTCAVVPSGVGKGRSFKMFFRHFIEAQKTRTRPRLRDDQGDPVAPARVPRVETLVNRAISHRMLMEMLDGNAMTLTLQREDGASLLRTDLFKTDTDALTQLWSGDPPLDWIVRGAELTAVDARGSLGFRIQPDLMYDYVAGPGRKHCKIGLWPRAIVGCYDPKRFPDNSGYSAKPGRYSPDAFHGRICVLAKQINDRRQAGDLARTPIRLDIQARAFMSALSYRLDEWKPNEYPDIEEAALRAWENTLRIAVVLQVFCIGAGEVSVDMVQRAWAIVEWSLSQYRLVFVESIPLPVRKARGAATTLAPQPKQPKLSKTEKAPRPHQDAQWVLRCMDRLCKPFLRETTLSEVRLLAGLPEKRFMSALAWLKLERIVWIRETEQGTTMGYL